MISLGELNKIVEDNFPFNEVHDAMKLGGWTWFSIDPVGIFSSSMNTPSVDRMKNTCSRLLKDSFLCKSDTSTGGFSIRYFKKKNYINISFAGDSSDLVVKMIIGLNTGEHSLTMKYKSVEKRDKKLESLLKKN